MGCAVGTLRVWMGFTPGFKLDLGDKDGLMPGREVDTMRYRFILTVKRNGEREQTVRIFVFVNIFNLNHSNGTLL